MIKDRSATKKNIFFFFFFFARAARAARSAKSARAARAARSARAARASSVSAIKDHSASLFIYALRTASLYKIFILYRCHGQKKNNCEALNGYPHNYFFKDQRY